MEKSFLKQQYLEYSAMPQKILVLASQDAGWDIVEANVEGHECFFCSYYLIGQLPELIGQQIIDDYDACLLVDFKASMPLYNDVIQRVSQKIPLLLGVGFEGELPSKLSYLMENSFMLSELTAEFLRQRVDNVVGSYSRVGVSCG
ncbi:hypothetical protein A9Q81_04225 [Gammaproteobacteria bacterium 42_54_T18]|nr:hypothetical protein A9Q81_04225 [Gammaproteobacteria bacterium 42_54_T18]